MGGRGNKAKHKHSTDIATYNAASALRVLIVSIVAGAQKRTNHSNHHCSALHTTLSRTLRSEQRDESSDCHHSGAACSRHGACGDQGVAVGIGHPPNMNKSPANRVQYITSSHHGGRGLRYGAQTLVVRANPITVSRVVITVGINFYPTVVCSSSHRASYSYK